MKKKALELILYTLNKDHVDLTHTCRRARARTHTHTHTHTLLTDSWWSIIPCTKYPGTPQLVKSKVRNTSRRRVHHTKRSASLMTLTAMPSSYENTSHLQKSHWHRKPTQESSVSVKSRLLQMQRNTKGIDR